MTGSTRSSDGLDVRRRRALFRSWHRGMREIDLILGAFADAEIGRLDERALDQYEALLDIPDGDMLAFLTGQRKPPPDDELPMLHRVIAHRNAVKP